MLFSMGLLYLFMYEKKKMIKLAWIQIIIFILISSKLYLIIS